MSTTNTHRQLLVQSTMQRNPLKLTQSEMVRAAVDRMTENHVSSLPIVDENDCLVGIVSLKDLLPVVAEKSRHGVGTIMTNNPIAVGSDETIHDAANLMIQHQVHHLPVIGPNNRLVGVISSIDFVRLAADGRLQAAV